MITHKEYIHWTDKNFKSYKTKFMFDFIIQLENKMDELGIDEEDISNHLNISVKKFNKIMNNPKKLKLKTIYKISKLINCHIGLILYDRKYGISKEHHGPVCPIIIEKSWKLCDNPVDMFEIEKRIKNKN